MLKSKILAYSYFVSAIPGCAQFIANAPLTSMLKILLDPIINHTIDGFAKVSATLLQDFMFFMLTLLPNIKSVQIQNNHNLNFWLTLCTK